MATKSKTTKATQDKSGWLPLGTATLVQRPWGKALVLDLARNPAARKLQAMMKAANLLD
jgi:hypothetical protein